MRERPQVALSITDPDNDYRYIQIMGSITEITEEGGNAHIDVLAKMPTREEALSQLVGVMQAPVSKFVRTMAEPTAKFVRTVAALRDQKGA